PLREHDGPREQRQRDENAENDLRDERRRDDQTKGPAGHGRADLREEDRHQTAPARCRAKNWNVSVSPASSDTVGCHARSSAAFVMITDERSCSPVRAGAFSMGAEAFAARFNVRARSSTLVSMPVPILNPRASSGPAGGNVRVAAARLARATSFTKT